MVEKFFIVCSILKYLSFQNIFFYCPQITQIAADYKTKGALVY